MKKLIQLSLAVMIIFSFGCAIMPHLADAYSLQTTGRHALIRESCNIKVIEEVEYNYSKRDYYIRFTVLPLYAGKCDGKVIYSLRWTDELGKNHEFNDLEFSWESYYSNDEHLIRIHGAPYKSPEELKNEYDYSFIDNLEIEIELKTCSHWMGE
jgi:hypothetical protein